MQNIRLFANRGDIEKTNITKIASPVDDPVVTAETSALTSQMEGAETPGCDLNNSTRESTNPQQKPNKKYISRKTDNSEQRQQLEANSNASESHSADNCVLQ